MPLAGDLTATDFYSSRACECMCVCARVSSLLHLEKLKG